MRLRLEGKDVSVEADCHCYGTYTVDGHEHLAYCLVVGPEQICGAMFANIASKQGVITTSERSLFRYDEAGYRRIVTRVQPACTRWVAMMIMTKNPRMLWQDDDDGLIEGLKAVTETPLLNHWAPALRVLLRDNGMINKLSGHRVSGSMLTVGTKDLDDIVCAGVKSGDLTMEEVIQKNRKEKK